MKKRPAAQTGATDPADFADISEGSEGQNAKPLQKNFDAEKNEDQPPHKFGLGLVFGTEYIADLQSYSGKKEGDTADDPHRRQNRHAQV